jgi:hypothetical protein
MGGVGIKKNIQKQQQTGMTRELLKIQHGSRPVVILDGPRNSRLRSSISSVESSPATAALEKYRQEANKQSSTVTTKKSKEAEPAKKSKSEPKPFEKLLASATTSNIISKPLTSLGRNHIEPSKFIDQAKTRSIIDEEDTEFEARSKHSKSQPIEEGSDIQTPFESSTHIKDRNPSTNVYFFSNNF